MLCVFEVFWLHYKNVIVFSGRLAKRAVMYAMPVFPDLVGFILVNFGTFWDLFGKPVWLLFAIGYF